MMTDLYPSVRPLPGKCRADGDHVLSNKPHEILALKSPKIQVLQVYLHSGSLGLFHSVDLHTELLYNTHRA